MAKVLLIDDDADIRFTFTKIGEAAGWEVISAESGPAGIEMTKEHRPDIILLDYHMPMMSGKETLIKIKEVYPESTVIVLTVDEREELAGELLSCGADDFALKPIRAQDLIARLEVHLRHRTIAEDKKATVAISEMELPKKGFPPETLKLVVKYLLTRNESVKINEVADALGIAYQTAHRYLNLLKEKSVVDVSFDYGYQGRPIIKYLLKKQVKLED